MTVHPDDRPGARPEAPADAANHPHPATHADHASPSARARYAERRAAAYAEARRRFIRLAQITSVATVVALIAGFTWFRATDTPFSGPFVIAVVVGVVGSMMIAAALMGLIFFSATSGLDEDADSSDF